MRDTYANAETADAPAGEGDPTPPAPEPTPLEQRQALFRLCAVLAAGALVAVVTGVTRTVLVVLALVAMIMIHELGHFVTAKWAGMKVTEYFLGFGPRLWSVRKGETEYGVKAIPAGGYVKIPGMVNIEKVDPADEPRTYRQQPYWRRISVAVAGSVTHFIMAFLLLYALFAAVGIEKEAPRVGSVSELENGPSPAQAAGLRVGDRLISYDGVRFTAFRDMAAYIRERPGRPIDLVVERSGERTTLTVTPADRRTVTVKGDPPASRPTAPTGFVGIGPASEVERSSPLAAVGQSASELGRITVATVKGLGAIFSPSGASSYGRQLVDSPSSAPAAPDGSEPRFLSPVGFTRLASQAAEAGWRQVLLLLALINVFVGMFNMVPLLPFDGGHVAIATYERLRSRRGHRYQADVSKAMPVFYAVVVLLVFIAVSSLYLDLVRPFGNPFQ
ncbi:MAG: RIP metalloprotease [Actinomycetota bacterium]|nr:RIP metalloprotease [Actinomycetota bacterium]MDQ3574870.1 RIP metalloprotease [Actinomycetota bacterium]